MTTPGSPVERSRQYQLRVLGFGLPFGLLTGVFCALQATHPLVGVIGGVVGGLVFGLVMSSWTARQQARADAALGSTPWRFDRVAFRRVAHDPRSAPAADRSRAIGIAEYRLSEFTRNRGRTVTILAATLLLEVIMAITASPWFWLAVALFAVVLLSSLLAGPRLRRDLDRLRAADLIPPGA